MWVVIANETGNELCPSCSAGHETGDLVRIQICYYSNIKMDDTYFLGLFCNTECEEEYTNIYEF